MSPETAQVWKLLHSVAWNVSCERNLIWDDKRCVNVSARAWRWLLGSNLHPDIWRQALRSQDDTPRSPAAELYKIWFNCAVIWIIDLANRDLKALDMGVDLDADESDDPPKGATMQASHLRDLPPFLAAQMLLWLLYDKSPMAYRVLIRWKTCSIKDIVNDLKLASEDEAFDLYEFAIGFLWTVLRDGDEGPNPGMSSKAWYPTLKDLQHPTPPASRLLKQVQQKYETKIRARGEEAFRLAEIAREFELTVEESLNLQSVLQALNALFEPQRRDERSSE